MLDSFIMTQKNSIAKEIKNKFKKYMWSMIVKNKNDFKTIFIALFRYFYIWINNINKF